MPGCQFVVGHFELPVSPMHGCVEDGRFVIAATAVEISGIFGW